MWYCTITSRRQTSHSHNSAHSDEKLTRPRELAILNLAEDCLSITNVGQPACRTDIHDDESDMLPFPSRFAYHCHQENAPPSRPGCFFIMPSHQEHVPPSTNSSWKIETISSQRTRSRKYSLDLIVHRSNYSLRSPDIFWPVRISYDLNKISSMAPSKSCIRMCTFISS
jgi:hypothetical protein